MFLLHPASVKTSNAGTKKVFSCFFIIRVNIYSYPTNCLFCRKRSGIVSIGVGAIGVFKPTGIASAGVGTIGVPESTGIAATRIRARRIPETTRIAGWGNTRAFQGNPPGLVKRGFCL